MQVFSISLKNSWISLVNVEEMMGKLAAFSWRLCPKVVPFFHGYGAAPSRPILDLRDFLLYSNCRTTVNVTHSAENHCIFS